MLRIRRRTGVSAPVDAPFAIMTTTTKHPTMPTTLLRYLAVGAFNTIFGYGCFALFTLLLTPLLSYGYVLASLIANLVSITFAFFGYKWFVFRTKGNYLKEWIRCVGVYGSSMILSAAALPFVVGVIDRKSTRLNSSHLGI